MNELSLITSNPRKPLFLIASGGQEKVSDNFWNFENDIWAEL